MNILCNSTKHQVRIYKRTKIILNNLQNKLIQQINVKQNIYDNRTQIMRTSSATKHLTHIRKSSPSIAHPNHDRHACPDRNYNSHSVSGFVNPNHDRHVRTRRCVSMRCVLVCACWFSMSQACSHHRKFGS